MSSLLEGAKRLVTRGTDIGARVNGLESAVQAARGRLDDALLDPADEIVGKAAERLRLSADHTVVALGGATGSGKSSTFNALVGLELASVSVRRPTTSWATACTWGVAGANELLEWLGIPPRHQILRDSMLDTGREAKDLDGLVLLDMPDHDSTEVAHHLEVDRLVKLADLLIWVLDPQKYADAALHDRFLKPLAAHKDVMLIVLNHIDEVAPERRPGMMADLRRLLDDDGLEGITLLATSAREGIGIDELRRTISARVADKAATRHRMATNISEVAAAMTAVSGDAPSPAFSVRDHAEIRAAVADAAGIPVVVEAVEKATLIRARRATGWPLTSWMWRLRADPLKKLQLDVPSGTRDLIAGARSAVPDANEVQNARVDTAVRDFADRLSADLSRPWATAIRRASVSRLPELEARLDRVVAETDLGVSRVPFWTRAVRALQWLLLLSAIAGGAWLVALAGISFLKLPDLPDTKVGSVPVPTLMLLGGAGLGVLLAVLCRLLVRRSARRKAAAAGARLRRAADDVTEELIIEPIEAELLAYRLTTEGLRAARG
ncbi:MAG: GTPase [Marmoricola sp.]